MMFLFVIPFLEALATFVLPLQLGTRDLPFPRLTALSYWTFVFGGLFLYASFLFGTVPDAGWFAYVPLSGPEYSPGRALDFWDIGLSVAEVAAIGAAAEFIVGILRMRAPGMSLDRLPPFGWAMLVTAFMIIFAFTPLIVATAMLELDRKELTRFFDARHGGSPLLWQHLFWVFGHPEVYIMLLPALGVVSQVVQAFARRPLASYTAVVFGMVAIGFVSFGLWVHHMFTTGLPAVALAFFAVASMVIAVPSGVQIATWIATLWTGTLAWRTPLLFVLGFVAIFVLGGLTGVMVAALPFNWQAHDTYFVVAHFHYVLIGGVLFPVFAGLYYWLPKLTGRLLDERLGRWNFWLMFAGFNVTFFPLHLAGLLGMPRRVYTYPAGLGWDGPNLVATLGALALGAGVLLFLVNLGWSLARGRPAGADPWSADTLEWSQASPVPDAQFGTLPAVGTRHPLWDAAGGTAPPAGPVRRALEALDHRPTAWRGALVVSMLEAAPVAVVHLPRSSFAPFVLAVGFLLVFVGALLDDGRWLGAGGLVSIAGLVVWFWPTATEAAAIREHAGPGARSDAGALPLALAGPTSNGWWGTLVLLLVLATALASLVASYFYLGGPAGGAGRPGTARPGLLVAATACALAAALVVRGARRAAERGRTARRRLAVVGGIGLHVAFVALTALDAAGRQLTPATSAYGSIFLGLLGFQWLAVLIALAMLAVGLAWALVRPTDPRGLAPVWNASLLTAFLAASWLGVAATLYLSPLLLSR
jgi:cytochrome c oxidase subunit I+III